MRNQHNVIHNLIGKMEARMVLEAKETMNPQSSGPITKDDLIYLVRYGTHRPRKIRFMDYVSS